LRYTGYPNEQRSPAVEQNSLIIEDRSYPNRNGGEKSLPCHRCREQVDVVVLIAAEGQNSFKRKGEAYLCRSCAEVVIFDEVWDSLQMIQRKWDKDHPEDE
jgi:hypothetical protein